MPAAGIPTICASTCDPVVGLPQRGEEWLMVEAASQEIARATSDARLVVREGTANVAELRLDKPRINIGRVVDVYRAEGLFRRNDLAFTAETEINASVSREHAHILYDRATGEYRLFNDRWYQRGARAGRVRRLDRPRRHEPGGPPRFPRRQAATRRRDPLRPRRGDLRAVAPRPRPRSPWLPTSR